jgi:hypothetical protein
MFRHSCGITRQLSASLAIARLIFGISSQTAHCEVQPLWRVREAPALRPLVVDFALLLSRFPARRDARNRVGVTPVQRLNACVKELTSW